MKRETSNVKSWLPFFIIVAAILLVSLAFLWPAPLEFPMDDTYIHFVYAQNLAEQGQLIFSFADEKGVGSTSLLWVLLLAGGHQVGLSMHALAKVLGIASLAVLGVGLYLLLRPIWGALPALAGALLVVLSGNMVWFALSGMETVLFLALGVVALLLYRVERWGWLGLALGLLTLTRPEGLVLAVTIGGFELRTLRPPRSMMSDLAGQNNHKGRISPSKSRFVDLGGLMGGLVVIGLICALVCGPWFGYLLWRTGHVLPTSAVGKQLSFAIGTRLVAERNESLAALARFTPLVYVGVWLAYLLEFVLGGIALPPPRVPIGAIIGNPGYSLSLWAVAGWVSVIIPLLVAVGQRVSNLRQWLEWIQDHSRRPLIIFLAWTALHNLSYMLFMPVPGTASRYGAINHIALWLALTSGLLSFLRRPRLSAWLVGGIILIATANTIYWDGVYDANLDHMQNVRIAAAHFVRDVLSPGERCAAFDVGAIRYHSRRPIVDMGGLIEPGAGRWFLEGACDRYLVENGVTCLILPGRSDTTESGGWFDFAEVLGLTTSSLFEMYPVATFEIDHERWLQGYLPTNNYQASVNVYQLLAGAD